MDELVKSSFHIRIQQRKVIFKHGKVLLCQNHIRLKRCQNCKEGQFVHVSCHFEFKFGMPETTEPSVLVTTAGAKQTDVHRKSLSFHTNG